MSPPGSPVPVPALRRLYWTARRVQPLAVAAHRVRRLRLLVRLRFDAVWYRSRVEVRLPADLRVGRRVVVSVAPGTSNVLRLGRRCSLGDGVRISLQGGEALIGDDVDVRQGSSLVVGGRLEIAGRVLLQPGCSLHCSERITVARLAVLSERVTVVDSSHFHTGPDDWIVDNVRTAPVHIGHNAWVGAKATVGRGVRVGDRSIVSANSLVTRDVPDGHLASGVPAEVRRPLARPGDGPGAT